MKTFLIVLCVTSLSIFSQIQSGLNQNICQKYKQSDSTLNSFYKKILKEYSTDTLFISKLKIAQNKWILSRDADLAALYPDTAHEAYGSANLMCRCVFLTSKTDERIKYLKQWIEKTEEGDMCSGSVKIK